jgi:glycosyltransferase involved in cell wall biosynthesis
VLGGSAPDDGADGAVFVPYLEGLGGDACAGGEPTAVLHRLEKIIEEAASRGRRADGAAAEGKRAAPIHDGAACIVMRQQLFCNASLAHVMFELTNALLELGAPAVAQDEAALLSKAYIHREEELWRAGAPGKYQRLKASLAAGYDPEAAITVHFSMLRAGLSYTRFGVFPGLTPREVLYTTGNHTVAPDGVRQLTGVFEKILAPSNHVLRPYLQAGLGPNCGAVIPHGIDPGAFSPQAQPAAYATEKRFKFLQTSFPWVYEKGFDLSVKAFSEAFTRRDDVALVLRTPRVRDPRERNATFGRLEALVKEAAAKPGAPEILLVESDVPPDRRGGVYTGADCYVFPLRAEGFAMTILEAMACGLPVIATPWSGPADYLSPRYNYTLRHSNPIPERAREGKPLRYHVEPDLDHLIYLMRQVYERQDEAKAMGCAAAKAARAGWTWKHAAAKLAAVLGAPLGGGPPVQADAP